MEIPKTVYHGTFRPDGMVKPVDRLTADVGYICTSERYGWAEYFAMCKRWRYKKQAGMLAIYEIDTEKLPEEVLEGKIPLGEIDPRSLEDPLLRRIEEEMKSERIKVREWRFPYIPLSAIRRLDEGYLQAEPELTLFKIGKFYRPDFLYE